MDMAWTKCRCVPAP